MNTATSMLSVPACNDNSLENHLDKALKAADEEELFATNDIEVLLKNLSE